MLVVALVGIRREPRRGADARAREPPEPQRRGQLPARAHRPVRVHRHRDRRRDDPGRRASSAPTRSSRCSIAGLMIRSGYALVKASGRVFLEAAPAGLDPRAIGQALVAAGRRDRGARPARVGNHERLPGAVGARAGGDARPTAIAARREMEAMLHERFGLDHTTLQVDHTGGELLDIGLSRTDPEPGGECVARRAALADLSARAHEHLVDAHVRRAGRSRTGWRWRCRRPRAA